MSEAIILKKKPKIEFQFRDNGFELFDEETKQNEGFYLLDDIQSVELNKAWFPRFAKWMKIFTWVLNGVPYFQDAKSYKKSNIIIRTKNRTIGFVLENPYMADNARKLNKALGRKLKCVEMADKE
jgi:hypothetical protein